jgi:uncharacterized protein (TIGR01777 family)
VTEAVAVARSTPKERIVIAGGSGLIGRYLTRALRSAGYSVTILSRAVVSTDDATVERVRWTPEATGDWCNYLNGATAVINLCGASIAGPRWTGLRKTELLESRRLPTLALVRAIAGLDLPPLHFIQASGVGYVGLGEAALDETAPPGDDFLAQLAVAWEDALADLTIPAARLRFGVVLAADGGALPQMVLPFKWFVGGPMGTGRQWLSWVHIDDAVAAILHTLNHRLQGPIHVTAPTPVRNVEFARTVGEVLSRPALFRLPRAVMELLLGEQATLVCDGQRALPSRLMASGFTFRFPVLANALQNILRPAR